MARVPSYYAELLLNIRTVTVFISLPTLPSAETRLALTDDCAAIMVLHEGQESTLRLPIQISRPKSLHLPLANLASALVHLRFKPADEDSILITKGEQAENVYPWSASIMPASCNLTCCTCGNSFAAFDSGQQWKDLPSENWAEMMDFWHCHKPQKAQTASTEDSTATRGYSASNSLTARLGVGFVDASRFLLHSRDCHGLKVPTVILIFCSLTAPQNWASRRRAFPTPSTL